MIRRSVFRCVTVTPLAAMTLIFLFSYGVGRAQQTDIVAFLGAGFSSEGKAVELALQKLNSDGNAKLKTLSSVIWLDPECNPAKSASEAQKLAEQQARLVVYDLCRSSAEAVQAIFAVNNITDVSVTGSVPQGSVLSLAPPISQEGALIGEYLNKTAGHRATVIHDAQVSAELLASVNKSTTSTLPNISFDARNQPSYGDAVGQAASNGAEIAVLLGPPDAALQLASFLKQKSRELQK